MWRRSPTKIIEPGLFLSLAISVLQSWNIIEFETFPVRQKDLDDGAKRAKASHPNSIGSGLYHAERIYISPAASG